MRPISKRNREIISSDPFYRKCARSDEGNCDGRITIEHSIIYAGRQLDDIWSLLPICSYHHAVNEHQDGDGMNKEKHVWIALNRATTGQLQAISKAINYVAMRDRLNKEYGN